MLDLLAALAPSAAGAEPAVERVEDRDWVTLSQQGLEPIRAGRFFVHTPAHRGEAPAGCDRARDRRRPRLRHRPARDDDRLPRRAQPAEGGRGGGRQSARPRHRHRPARLRGAEAVARRPRRRLRQRSGGDRGERGECGDQRRPAGPGARRSSSSLVAEGMDHPRLQARGALRPRHRQHPRRAADRARALGGARRSRRADG